MIIRTLVVGICLITLSHQVSALDCGDRITRTVSLTADLLDCPAEGLVIGADGVTVYLNGHTIGGTGFSAGISILADNKVRILGPGVIEGFETGIAANNGYFHRYADLTISDVNLGVYWLNTASSVIDNLDIETRINGITIDGTSQDNELSHNHIEGGDGEAIWVRSGSNNHLRGNYLTQNQTGLAISGGSNNTFEYNHAINNGVGVLIAKGAVPLVGPAHANRIVWNKIYDNQQGIVISADGSASWQKYNHIERNAIRGGRNGLIIYERNYKTRVYRNSLFGQTDESILDFGTRTDFVGNRCDGLVCP